MIPATLARPFSDVTRARGQQLLASGAVAMAHANSELVTGMVQGSVPYSCSVQATSGQLEVSCTCPYATAGNACKHLWAFLMALDANGALTGLLVSSRNVHEVVVNGDVHELGVTGDILSEPPPPAIRPPETPSWQHALDRARWRIQYADEVEKRDRMEWPDDRRLVYVVDAGASRNAPGVVVELGTEKRARDGAWGPAKPFDFPTAMWFSAPDEIDHQIARMLLGAAPMPDYGRARTTFVLPTHNYDTVLRMICDTGRARLRTPGTRTYLSTLRWDDGGESRAAWQFMLNIKRTRSGEHVLEGTLVRGSETLPLDAPDLLHQSGVIIVRDRVARFDHNGAFPIVSELQSVPGMAVGRDVWAVVSRLYAMPRVPAFTVPDDITIHEAFGEPTPVLTFVEDPEPWQRKNSAGLQLTFAYDAMRVSASERGPTRFDATSHTLQHRNLRAESAARARLIALGATSVRDVYADPVSLVVARQRVPNLAFQLAREGWKVEADGRAFRTPGAVQATVRSGVDWFDLDGVVEYGDTTASLSAVLDAQRRGEDMVQLTDGSYGLLPSAWLAKLGPLFASGEIGEHGTRFRTDADRAARCTARALPDADVDATFAKAREELARSIASSPSTRRRRSRDAARIPARRTRLAALPSPVRARRLSRRRHGTRQDGAGARAARGAALEGARSVARRRAAFARVQLDRARPSGSRRSCACSTQSGDRRSVDRRHRYRAADRRA